MMIRVRNKNASGETKSELADQIKGQEEIIEK
jgi:hypothetical protein